jgi:hypothetical protein
MDIITGKILKLNNWPDGKIIGIAKRTSTQLSEQGLDRETILARLEAVRQNPGPFLADELMAELACECIRIGQKDLPSNDTPRQTPLKYPIWGVENHHNFAWAEKLPDGRNVIVHRKGATPSSAGILGVIPGSMGDAGYVVRGRGAGASLESASHGAGRLMSRKAALNSISKSMRDEYLRERGVTLLGGGMDEAPQAYKPIDSIIAAQNDLVDDAGEY